jgi:hypothetical protein
MERKFISATDELLLTEWTDLTRVLSKSMMCFQVIYQSIAILKQNARKGALVEDATICIDICENMFPIDCVNNYRDAIAIGLWTTYFHSLARHILILLLQTSQLNGSPDRAAIDRGGRRL